SSKNRETGLPPLLVVVDALDEIESDEGVAFLQDLVTATSGTQGGLRRLKILVTSRPHEKIRNLAQSFPVDNVYHLETISKDDARADIQKFFLEKLPGIDKWGEKELDTLLDRADGLFIYAATIWRRVVEDPSEPPTPLELEELVSKEVGNSISGGGMDALYQQIVSTAIEAARGNRRKALAVLHSAILAERPLSLNEINHLADIKDPIRVERTIKSLHAVIRVSNDGYIFTYHKSFSDFMLDATRSCDITCAQSPAYGTFAQTCLDTMLTSLRFNMCNLPSSYLFDNEVPDIRKRVEEGILNGNALEYSCRFWMSHFGSSIPDNTLHTKMSTFVREKILYWVEAMNLLGARSQCLLAVVHLREWCQKSKVSHEVLVAVNSLMKLSRLYLQSPACQSTPHLYISALATEIGRSDDFPRPWIERFTQLPRVKFTGDRGALSTIAVNSIVNSVAFSPDGTWVVSGLGDNSVRIWDASTGEEKHKLDGHTRGVTSVAFSPDGTRVVSGSRDNSVRIWDASTGKEKHELDGHAKWVSSVAFSPDGTRVVSGSYDNSVRIWDTSTSEEKHKLDGHTNGVSSVAFSPDGTRVVSGSWDNSVRIWDASTGEEKHKLDGHTRGVSSVAFSPDGTRVVSGS
ncbi:quinon protein alcohol dehydrogenase-like superfamily, partial [Pterulicium gracile]